jgi:hypothetical protein
VSGHGYRVIAGMRIILSFEVLYSLTSWHETDRNSIIERQFVVPLRNPPFPVQLIKLLLLGHQQVLQSVQFPLKYGYLFLENMAGIACHRVGEVLAMVLRYKYLLGLVIVDIRLRQLVVLTNLL